MLPGRTFLVPLNQFRSVSLSLFLNSYRFPVTFNLYKYFMNLTVPLTHLGTQHTMCDSNCYQRLSWENAPNDNRSLFTTTQLVLIVSVLMCQSSAGCLEGWRITNPGCPFQQNSKKGITKKDQTLNDPELLLSM